MDRAFTGPYISVYGTELVIKDFNLQLLKMLSRNLCGFVHSAHSKCIWKNANGYYPHVKERRGMLHSPQTEQRLAWVKESMLQ